MRPDRYALPEGRMPAPERKPSHSRRLIPWIATAALCVAKLSGANIPLWLCLAPALLPLVAICAVLSAAAILIVTLLGAYIVAGVYALVTGKEME